MLSGGPRAGRQTGLKGVYARGAFPPAPTTASARPANQLEQGARRLAVHQPDLALVQLQNALHDHQSQPAAVARAMTQRRGAREQTGAQRGGNAFASVGDLHPQALRQPRQPQRDRRPAACGGWRCPAGRSTGRSGGISICSRCRRASAASSNFCATSASARAARTLQAPAAPARTPAAPARTTPAPAGPPCGFAPARCPGSDDAHRLRASRPSTAAFPDSRATRSAACADRARYWRPCHGAAGPGASARAIAPRCGGPSAAPQRDDLVAAASGVRGAILATVLVAIPAAILQRRQRALSPPSKARTARARAAAA